MPDHRASTFTDAETLRNYVRENQRYPIPPSDWPRFLRTSDTAVLEDAKRGLREVSPRKVLADITYANTDDLMDQRRRLLDQIDRQLAHREFPLRSEWPVDPSLVEDVAQYPTFTTTHSSSDIGRGFEDWHSLYRGQSADDLAFIADAVRVGLTPSETTLDTDEPQTSTERAAIVDGLRYYKSGAAVEITDLIRLTRRGDGADVDEVRPRAEQVFDRLHPVIGAMLAARTPEIKTNASDNSYYRYRDRDNSEMDHSVNVSSERGRYRDERCTTALVFGWSLVNMLQIASRTPSNDDESRDEWERYFYSVDDAVETLYNQRNRSREETPRWTSLHDRLETIDEAFRAGEFDPIHDRQRKRGKDLLAYGFERWIAVPDQYQTEQPQLAEFFTDYYQRDALAATDP